MIYGYARVSHTHQNIDRQIVALNERGVDVIYQEKMSGKDTNRPLLKKMLRKIKTGDLVVIQSLDRLGRNYNDIFEIWKYITKAKECDIEVLDMPILNTRSTINGLDGKFISDLVLNILAYVAQKEREKIKERQRQGIDIAMQKGVKFGRPRKGRAEVMPLVREYAKQRTDLNIYLKATNLPKASFYRLLKEVENEDRVCN